MSTPEHTHESKAKSVRESALKALASVQLTPETNIKSALNHPKWRIRNAVVELLNTFQLKLEMPVSEILESCQIFEDLIQLTEKTFPLVESSEISEEEGLFDETDDYVPSSKYQPQIVAEKERQARLKRVNANMAKLRELKTKHKKSDDTSKSDDSFAS